MLIMAALFNPVDAVRTGALLSIEGTAAFGAASLALLRFTGGTGRAFLLVGASLVAWLVIPLLLASRRLSRAYFSEAARMPLASGPRPGEACGFGCGGRGTQPPEMR